MRGERDRFEEFGVRGDRAMVWGISWQGLPLSGGSTGARMLRFVGGEAGEKIRESVKFDEDNSGCRRRACRCSREHRSVHARAWGVVPENRDFESFFTEKMIFDDQVSLRPPAGAALMRAARPFKRASF